ncbi:MAG: diaminopimelate epimerase [Desulfobacter sp.]|nr:diaminopimelate epimerase [Desulfobacter sp.]WDP85317.1 MAG: diaminopimelate epimerase [Desulfobacter sp.]
MEIEFWKMEGLGNDFIMMDDRDEKIMGQISYSDLAIRLCDRHFGIGGDGIILAKHSDTHDIRFVIINSDGTEPQMCGNGMRCFAKYLYETGILVKEEIRVETLAGTVIPRVKIDSKDQVVSVRVDMGTPELSPLKIPFVCDKKKAVEERLETQEGNVSVTCVSMGNPHAVIFVDDLNRINVKKQGIAVETHERFPEKTNVEFIQVLSDNELDMKVWERGAGITLACGTGACASLVAAHLTGRTGDHALVHLAGGDLEIHWDRKTGHLFKTGPACLAFEGRIRI